MKRTTKRTERNRLAKHKNRNANAIRRHNARAAFLRNKQAAAEARAEVAELITQNINS